VNNCSGNFRNVGKLNPHHPMAIHDSSNSNDEKLAGLGRFGLQIYGLGIQRAVLIGVENL